MLAGLENAAFTPTFAALEARMEVCVNAARWRLERVYTLTLYGGAPPAAFAVNAALVWRRAAPPLSV